MEDMSEHREEGGETTDLGGGAAEVAGTGAGAGVVQLKWCEVNTPFSEDQVASGIEWLDEPQKYGGQARRVSQTNTPRE